MDKVVRKRWIRLMQKYSWVRSRAPVGAGPQDSGAWGNSKWRKFLFLMKDRPARLLTLRRAASLSRKELADRVGVSEKTVRVWETQDCEISIGHRAALCAALVIGRGQEAIVGSAGEAMGVDVKPPQFWALPVGNLRQLFFPPAGQAVIPWLAGLLRAVPAGFFVPSFSPNRNRRLPLLNFQISPHLRTMEEKFHESVEELNLRFSLTIAALWLCAGQVGWLLLPANFAERLWPGGWLLAAIEWVQEWWEFGLLVCVLQLCGLLYQYARLERTHRLFRLALVRSL